MSWAFWRRSFWPKSRGRNLHDPRVIWNTQVVVSQAGGQAVMATTGHAFLKAAMRQTGAVYGGEMSAHHYFRDFMSCDFGMIPWLLVAELVSRAGNPCAICWRPGGLSFLVGRDQLSGDGCAGSGGQGRGSL